MRRAALPPDALDVTDRAVLNALQDGLPVTARPFAEAARQLELPERELIERVATFAALLQMALQ